MSKKYTVINGKKIKSEKDQVSLMGYVSKAKKALKYIACSPTGVVYAFTSKPKLEENSFSTTGEYIKLGSTKNEKLISNWKNSLIKII